MEESGPGETYQTPPITNQLEAVVAQEFSDPSLWSGQEPVRMTCGTVAGLKRTFGSDTTYLLGEGNPAEHWVTLLYGSRVVPGGNKWDVVRMETVSLEAMVAMHNHLARTVLAGEHARPSALVEPPVTRLSEITRHPNGVFWLQEIARSVWPIMATDWRRPDGTPIYFSHDCEDYHNAVCLLLPRETQDLITQVAQHELAWFTEHMAGNVPRMLSLAGDTEQNPFRVGSVGKVPHKSGIDIIDQVTSAGSYVDLLHYLMHGEGGTTPEDRLRLVKEHTPLDIAYYYNYGPMDQAARNLRGMRMHTAVMVNFISRHRDGRNVTPEVVDTACQGFEEGALRVAKKVLGNYSSATIGTATTNSLPYRTQATAAGLTALRSGYIWNYPRPGAGYEYER